MDQRLADQMDEHPFLAAWRTSDGGIAVHIDPQKLGKSAEAGLILADLYRHFARALTQNGAAQSEEHARAEMISLFLAELQEPTDEGSGSIHKH